MSRSTNKTEKPTTFSVKETSSKKFFSRFSVYSFISAKIKMGIKHAVTKYPYIVM